MVTLRCMLCIAVIQWAAVATRGINEEGMQKAITSTINKNNTDTICLKSKAIGKTKTGICVYIHEEKATWEDAQRICTESGGHLPEDHKRTSEDYSRKRLEETNIAYITTQIKFPAGSWLGGRKHPMEGADDLDLELGTGDKHMCDLHKLPPPPGSQWRGPPPPPPLPPKDSQESECHKQHRFKCGTVYNLRNGTIGSSRCDCFRRRPYVCLTPRNKHTNICPNGFNQCLVFHLCYKVGDPESNWFKANQQCGDDNSELPDMNKESLDNITAIMECAELYDIWTSSSDVVWAWNTTGIYTYPSQHCQDTRSYADHCLVCKQNKGCGISVVTGVIRQRSSSMEGEKITITNWEARQPKCPPNDCIKMAANGEWFTEDCNLKSNFMCIERNFTCENTSCEVVPYYDSSKEVTDDQSTTTSTELRHIPLGESQQINDKATIGIVVGLIVLVIIITIILSVVCCKIKKYRKKAKELNVALEDQATYYQTLSRHYSIYENDGPEFEAYAELVPDSPGDCKEITSQDICASPSGNDYTTSPEGNVYTTVGNTNHPSTVDTNDVQLKLKFLPRKGSLPARPDVVPQMATNPQAEDYLEVFPVPYSDFRRLQKIQDNECKNDYKPRTDLENLGYLSEEDEEDYADRDVNKDDDTNTELDGADVEADGNCDQAEPDEALDSRQEELCSAHNKDETIISPATQKVPDSGKEVHQETEDVVLQQKALAEKSDSNKILKTSL